MRSLSLLSLFSSTASEYQVIVVVVGLDVLAFLERSM